MKKLILSMLSFFIIANVPTVAYAITVHVTPPGGPTTDLGSAGATSVSLTDPATGSCSPPCRRQYGIFDISDASATNRAVVKIEGTTTKKLTLTNAIIKNARGASGTFAELSISYEHTYSSGVSEDAQQNFGITVSGNFVRGTLLASGDRITVQGFGGFDECNEGCVVEDQIGITLAYEVPVSGTLSKNTISPSPLQTTDNFSCNDLAYEVESGCDATVPAFMRSQVFTIRLRSGDTLKLLGSINQVVAETEEDRNSALSLLSLPVDIKPGSSDNPVNLKSHGVIPVAILGTDTLDVTTIDPLSVQFGPNGATEAHGRGHYGDVNGDGFTDLVLHFETQDTGLECGDTSAILTGLTLDGEPIEGSDSILIRCK